MKRESLKSLKLKKSTVSNLNEVKMRKLVGGGHTDNSCTATCENWSCSCTTDPHLTAKCLIA